MNPWVQILVAAGVSNLLRALPAAALRKLVIKEDGMLGEFLQYAAYGVMGGIIYSTLYGKELIAHPQALFTAPQLLKFVIVVATLVLTAVTRSIATALLTCLAAYAALAWFLYT